MQIMIDVINLPSILCHNTTEFQIFLIMKSLSMTLKLGPSLSPILWKGCKTCPKVAAASFICLYGFYFSEKYSRLSDNEMIWDTIPALTCENAQPQSNFRHWIPIRGQVEGWIPDLNLIWGANARFDFEITTDIWRGRFIDITIDKCRCRVSLITDSIVYALWHMPKPGLSSMHRWTSIRKQHATLFVNDQNTHRVYTRYLVEVKTRKHGSFSLLNFFIATFHPHLLELGSNERKNCRLLHYMYCTKKYLNLLKPTILEYSTQVEELIGRHLGIVFFSKSWVIMIFSQTLLWPYFPILVSYYLESSFPPQT